MKLIERLESLLSPPSEISSEWLDAISNALSVVSRFKNPEATDILLRALRLWETDKTNSGTQIRMSIIDTLGALNDSKAFEPLLEGLKDDSPYIIKSTVDALGELGDSRAINPLVETLNISGKKCKDIRIKRLHEDSDSQEFDFQKHCSEDEEEKVLNSAVYALSKLKALKSLTEFLQHENPILRERAVWGLGLMEDATALEPLAIALKDSGSEVRKSAASALGSLKENRAMPHLTEALNDTDAKVRSQIVQSLSNLKAVDSLIIALADADEFVRERAANCLGRLEDSKAVEPLSHLLEDSSFFVREAAKQAIVKLSK